MTTCQVVAAGWQPAAESDKMPNFQSPVTRRHAKMENGVQRTARPTFTVWSTAILMKAVMLSAAKHL